MNRIPVVAGLALLAVAAVIFPPSAFVAEPNTILIDARSQRAAQPAPLPGMAGRSSSGHEISVNSQFLTLDGKPWLPVMGEFHYSRYPEQYWEEELLKMKAGGVQIVATYVFWIHHEEIEGQFDWSGRRDLRRFVELCRKHNLYVFLRIGPYAHGEVRNGGLPDWIVAAGNTRKNDPQYLARVRRYFGELGEQVKGLFWKDGGPIIDIQLENEYSQRGPGAGAAHISELKKIAQAAGFITPLYTVTGWDNADYPPEEVIPVYGGYVDNFWDSSLKDLPPAGYYLFEKLSASSDAPDAEHVPKISYPFFMAEAGGGMQVAYHRRPVIDGDDVAAMTLTRLASGVNLYGYYMFQGGANPDGKRTSLQESVETDHVYDLPKVSYDFQAPLGQYGQMNPAFRATKLFHLFLNAFGGDLATMATVLPQTSPSDPNDRATIRAAARVRGDRGFVFVNNYQRLYPLPEQHSVQIKLDLPSETLALPQAPIDIPSGAYFFWPVNFDLGGALLKYASAQPLTKIRDGNADYYVFFSQPGIPAEFSLDEDTVRSIHADKGLISSRGGRICVSKLAPARAISFRVQSKKGKTTHVILLNRKDAENAWKISVGGRERLILTQADVFTESETLHLRARKPGDLTFSVFPDFPRAPSSSATLTHKALSGLFATYSVNIRPETIPVRWQNTRKADSAGPARMGKYNAIAPTDADFEHAGIWSIEVPDHSFAGLSDIYLRIDYAGDVARLYSEQHLLDDDFYKGTTWEVGLKRFQRDNSGNISFELRVLPLRNDAPVYIPSDLRPSFSSGNAIATVSRITCSPEYELRVKAP